MAPLRSLAVAAVLSVGRASSYFNPVLQRDFPDPTVTRANDGSFYAYATMGNGCTFQAANSSDMVNWTYLGEAMPAKPAWALQGSGGASWAPDVAYHNNSEAAMGPGYYMYFAMKHTAGYMCIGVAYSAVPAGPFVDARGSPLYCDADDHAIDPKSFDDPLSDNIYLYFGSDFIPLRALQLSRNRTSLSSPAPPQDMIQMSGAPYEGLVEGSWVWYRPPAGSGSPSAPGGTYYFMYSGDNCCGTTAHYAVMVARGPTPLGPFEKLGPATGQPNNDSSIITALLNSGYPFAAPGHNSLVTDDAGVDWMYYHAYNFSSPSGGEGAGRQLMMDRIDYVPIPGSTGLWPVLASAGNTAGKPGIGPLPAPTVNHV